jgi:hypothetical protein
MTAGCCGAVMVGIRPVSSLGRCVSCGTQVVIRADLGEPIKAFILEQLNRPDARIQWGPK